MLPQRRKPEESNVDAWLMSYADMITLLLCFFIIFVSVSEPRKDKLAAVTEGLVTKFGSVDLSTPFQGLFRSLQAVVEKHQILRDVAITRSDTSVTMELSTLAFYQPDSAEFNKDKLDILTELAMALQSIHFMNYRIIVEGHTSDVPFKNQLYPSNWELSSARAARMVRFFIEQGIPPNHLEVVGYADTAPKVPNRDANGDPILENRSQNQRVVIKVERVL